MRAVLYLGVVYLPCGCVGDRLSRGAQRNPERLEMCSQGEMVVLLAREAREVEDDDELHFAFVDAAT